MDIIIAYNAVPFINILGVQLTYGGVAVGSSMESVVEISLLIAYVLAFYLTLSKLYEIPPSCWNKCFRPKCIVAGACTLITGTIACLVLAAYY